MATYISMIVVFVILNPHSAAQRLSRPSVVTLVVNITTRNYDLNALMSQSPYMYT